jgi:hypothetical protein
VFTPDDFRPGEIQWDSFDVDPALPLSAQMEPFTQDLIWVKYPNGCELDVAWSAHPGRKSEFVVSLTETLPGQEWEPFEQRRCESIRELRAAVKELVEVATKRPPLDSGGK